MAAKPTTPRSFGDIIFASWMGTEASSSVRATCSQNCKAGPKGSRASGSASVRRSVCMIRSTSLSRKPRESAKPSI
nr:hypothetical protein [Myxococcus sp. SDU36]